MSPLEILSNRLLDRENPARIHLIGVAGSGMSGLALILLEMGHHVSGCDKVTSGETERLQGVGLTFYSPHTADSVVEADFVIYSSAIRQDNPALANALQLGIRCLRRAECLAAVLNSMRGVLVAGTHGKTTTSALCVHLLRESRMRPSHYVGAEIPVLGANAHWNEQSEFLVAEGDESDGTLVNYTPEHSIILNIEAEHLDYYRDLAHIKSVFARLCTQTSGTIVYCGEDSGARDVCKAHPYAVSYGWTGADFVAQDVQEARGRTLFTVVKHGEVLGRVELGIPGRHNVLNALAAIAMALTMGAEFESIVGGLASFAGAKRRFETKYLSKDYRIVDDYGHHPTELAATLQTARSLQPNRLIVLFQPHRFTRTQLLANEFGVALQAADHVFVADIYPASETPIDGITGQTIVDAMQRHGDTPAEYIGPIATAHYKVGNMLEPGDLVVTLGAGNIHECGVKLARDLHYMEDLLRNVNPQELTVKLYEPMHTRTTMRVGGVAQYWLEPSTFESMRIAVEYFRERTQPVCMIGRGSNVIVRSGGIRGAVVHPSGGEFESITVVCNRITAGADVRLKKLAAVAMQYGLSGFEWMDGVPGNVGGSLRMNAGAMATCMWDLFVSAKCLNEDGCIAEHEREQTLAEYRQISAFLNNYVLEATFQGTPAPASQIEASMEASRQRRRQTQPVGASAGCIFKNPEGHSAGKLIDELGLKGTRVGDAVVSALHANFIINEGSATATDVTQLIDLIRDTVKEQKDITLRSEAQVIGDREPQF